MFFFCKSWAKQKSRKGKFSFFFLQCLQCTEFNIFLSLRNPVSSAEELKPFVSPVVALFLLCQVFLIITHYPLGEVVLVCWLVGWFGNL